MDLTMRRQWTAALLQLHAVRERLLRLPTPTPLRHAQRPLPWRAIIRQAASLWLATRLAYAVLTLYVPLATGTELPSHTPISAVSLIHLWANWDGAIYLHIAQVGYYSPTISSFFPLYPAAIRLVATLIGPHWVVSGLIISNLSALLACIGIASLAAQIAPAGEEARVARNAVTLFLAYPLAFFLVATYSDGLFAGLAALTLFFALRRRWGWVALFSALAALARPIAPALLLPLAWEALQRYREARAVMSQRQAIRVALPGLAALLAPIASVGAYCLFLWSRFGDPLIFLKAESAWAHFSLSPLLSIPVAILAFANTPLASPLQLRILLDLAPVICGLILALLASRRAPLALTLYTLSLLYIVTSVPIDFTDLFVSGGRYMLAAVPLFALSGGWLRRSEWLLPALCWCGALLQALLAVYYLRHGWLV